MVSCHGDGFWNATKFMNRLFPYALASTNAPIEFDRRDDPFV
jgi:hypothetical protein